MVALGQISYFNGRNKEDSVTLTWYVLGKTDIFYKIKLTQILWQRLIKTFITSKYEVDGQEACNIFIMTHLFTFSSLFILVSNAGIGKGCWKPLFAIFPFFSQRSIAG